MSIRLFCYLTSHAYYGETSSEYTNGCEASSRTRIISGSIIPFFIFMSWIESTTVQRCEAPKIDSSFIIYKLNRRLLQILTQYKPTWWLYNQDRVLQRKMWPPPHHNIIYFFPPTFYEILWSLRYHWLSSIAHHAVLSLIALQCLKVRSLVTKTTVPSKQSQPRSCLHMLSSRILYIVGMLQFSWLNTFINCLDANCFFLSY